MAHTDPGTAEVPALPCIEDGDQTPAPSCDDAPRFATGTEAGLSQQDLLASLEASFERALRSMTMVYQPIVRPDGERAVYGYEALLRPNDEAVPHPGVMLDLAERLGRLERLGRTVRELVAERIDALPPGALFFVNLHPMDLVDPCLASPYSALARHAKRIVLEITERASLRSIPDLRYRVAELREMGYRIAIDDLGAGHSRMNDVSPLDTDVVKLDMSLIRDIDRHDGRRTLVGQVTRFCQDQGILVVAEGIETEAECEVLTELGCDLLQGYLIARPGASIGGA